MSGTVMITGATSGIGRALVGLLADRGVSVLATGRCETRLAALRQACEGMPGTVRTECADFTDQAQVVALGRRVRESGLDLQALVHMAGSLSAERRETVDGHELQLAVNYLAVFGLTRELLPALVDGATVLTIGSEAHRFGTIDFDDPGMVHGWSTMGSYRRSKLASVAFARELADREPRLRSVAMHPGLVATEIGTKDSPRLVQLAWRLMRPLQVCPEVAAERVVAQLEADGAPTGSYVNGTRIQPASDRVQDADFRRRLWTWTEAVLTPDPRQSG